MKACLKGLGYDHIAKGPGRGMKFVPIDIVSEEGILWKESRHDRNNAKGGQNAQVHNYTTKKTTSVVSVTNAG